MTSEDKLTKLAEDSLLIDSALITKISKIVDEDAITTTLEYYFPYHQWDESDYLDTKLDFRTKISIMSYKVNQYLDKKKINKT